MKQIIPGVRSWSVFNADKGLDFNGWYVEHGGEAVVIDPPSPGDTVLDAIAALGAPRAVLLTNKDHARASDAFRARFDCPIRIHERDAVAAAVDPKAAFTDGSILPCGLAAIRVAHGKSPGETVFLFEGPTRALIVGDAVIGKPAGALSMLPDAKFADPAAAKRGLRVLLEYDFEALLLGDGTPITHSAKTVLEAFLA